MGPEGPHPTHSAPVDARPLGRLLSRLAALALIAAAAHRVRPGWRRVLVEGVSMVPTLAPDDRLLLVRAHTYRAGQLVGFPDPRRPEKTLIKRVHRVEGAMLELRGDNAAASTDSRHFGPIPARTALGRAVYRYAPPERAGRLRSARRYDRP